MARKKNKNIVPIKNVCELGKEADYADFKFKNYFKHLCNLHPNRELEKLEIEAVDVANMNVAGLVYIFVVEGKIFKIGHSITPITKRVQSYNCGKTEYRINGTNSTTNYFVLQSLLKIGKTVNVFAFFPEKPTYTVFGKEYKDSLPSSKRAEHEILKHFEKEYGKKPIGCTQK